MLHIHFSGEDFGRVHLTARPDPAWETLLSLHVLGRGPGRTDLTLAAWRARTLAQPDRAVRRLLPLAPPRGYSPDFLTPHGGGADMESTVEAVAATSGRRLRTDLETHLAEHRPTPLLRALAEGSAGGLRCLARSLLHHHHRALAPHWPQISARVHDAAAAAARTLAGRGVFGLFSALHPAVRWEPPVLKVAYARRGDLYLNGRGLRLVPSFFCQERPITLRDPTLPPVLVYPVDRGMPLGAWRDRPAAQGALGRLMGRTRAAMLELIATTDGATGGDLARRLHISASTTSEHATALRDAGLITTCRTGGSVRHAVTPLGRNLLEGRADGPAGGVDAPASVLRKPRE